MTKMNEDKIFIKPLNLKNIENSVNELVKISTSFEDKPWQAENFLVNLPMKWEFSLLAINSLGNIKGYIIASQNAKENVHIHKFTVTNPSKNQAIGRKLLRKLLGICLENNINTITLKIYFENKPLRRIYKLLGFIATNENNEYLAMKGNVESVSKYLKPIHSEIFSS